MSSLPIPDGKYNSWCERKPLVQRSQESLQKAMSFSIRADLSKAEKEVYYAHELTGSPGFEFVVICSFKFDQPIQFINSITLVPCFLPDLNGQNLKNPSFLATLRMQQRNRFIYDGWLPITDWSIDSVRRILRDLEEALVIFGLHADVVLTWEAKYPVSSSMPGSSYAEYEQAHFDEVAGVAKALTSLGNEDRVAIYRSLAWFAQSRRQDPLARFLFLMLTIESLATYIEEMANSASPLATLRSSCLSKEERRLEREDCIEQKLQGDHKGDFSKVIRTAYFDCVVGIKKTLEAHLAHVFFDKKEFCALLFSKEFQGKSLYDLRHTIAHGTADVLSEFQRDAIERRCSDIEEIARKYVLRALRKVIGFPPFSKEIRFALSIPLTNAVTSQQGMYQGPTQMALLYS